MRGNKSKTFLHVGCGQLRKDKTTREFSKPDWRELRLDIDASVNPDFVGTMTDMSDVSSSSVDAIYSSHNIEHLYVHEVPLALSEFKRVLKKNGLVVITCPDLQEVARQLGYPRQCTGDRDDRPGNSVAAEHIQPHLPQMSL